jgi:hypothetical protein
MNTRTAWILLAALAALSLVAELAVHMHPHFAVDALFGFNAGFALLAAVALIALARALAAWLGRDRRFYDDDD